MPNRENWTSGLGFVLAAAGSAVGLGNLWKFPYITFANDGGAFVLVYLVCILVVGMPIMMAEILIGKRSQKSAVGAMAAVGQRWAWVGGLGVFTGFVLLSFYTVVAGWTIHSFIQCLKWSFGSFPTDLSMGDEFGAFVGKGGLQVGLSAAFMLVTILVVSSGVKGGIERAAKVLLPILLGILLIVLVAALRMSGSGDALSFIFRPDFSKLTGHSVLEALGHAFFTLSLGMGAMITYGSYMQKKESVFKNSAWVVALDTGIALLATIIMFSVIFSSPGVRESVGKSTAGMLFITMPTLFYTEVPGGAILAPLFYLLVGFAALTSTVSLLEVVSSYFIDQRGMNRVRASVMSGAGIFVVTILCGLSLGAVSSLGGFQIGFLGGGKAGLFNVLDHLVANWLLPIGGLMITLAAGWVLSGSAAQEQIETPDAPAATYPLWRVFIRFISPLAVGAILFFVIFKGADFS